MTPNERFLLAFAFGTFFAVYPLWVILAALRDGYIRRSSVTPRYYRDGQPFTYWLGIAGHVIIAFVGFIFLWLLLTGRVDYSDPF